MVIVLAVLLVTVEVAPTSTRAGTAEEELRSAEQALSLIQDQLDRLSDAYTTAVQHTARLEREAGESLQRLERTEQALTEARTAAAAMIRGRYQHPGGRAQWVLRALRSRGTAGRVLHRLALLEQIPVGLAARTAEVDRQTGQMSADASVHAATMLGATAAAVDLRGAAADLQAQLEVASAAVRASRDRVQADGLVLATPGLPVCPLGAPNGFSDSWGAPRSGGRGHMGVDMFAARGTPVFAVAAGRVRVGSNRLGGLTVNLDDSAGNSYYYAHLETARVSDGQAVGPGAVLGTAGTSGNAVGTPPHLHWQVRPPGGAPINPYPLARALCRN